MVSLKEEMIFFHIIVIRRREQYRIILQELVFVRRIL